MGNSYYIGPNVFKCKKLSKNIPVYTHYVPIYNVRIKCFVKYKRGKTNKIDFSLHYFNNACFLTWFSKLHIKPKYSDRQILYLMNPT